MAETGPDATVWHGGDLAAADALFPGAPKPWIDLSTGINPIAYPVGELALSAFRRLPAPAEHRRLEDIAAAAYRAREGTATVAAPGTQCLIEMLPWLRPRCRVAIVGPTYAEHAISWKKAGHAVREVASLPDATAAADVAVVVNPNNPDGGVTSRADLLAAAEDLRRREGWLVVDEAFADFEDAESLAPDLPENVVVLRSFGKTYGLAGIRLGFAIAAVPTADALRARLGPWSVSGPAIELGARALADGNWLAAAREARARDTARLDAMLSPRLGAPVGGTLLFRTLASDTAPALFDGLGRAGIWVRRFSRDPRLLRFGLPGSEEEWERLASALEG